MNKQDLIIPNDYTEVTKIGDIQKLLVSLMKEIHDICESHEIIYNVFGGTMLGVVRHQGIIPWDDDIDITMPRPDYEKFIKLVRSSLSDKYCVYTYPDEGYAYPFAKFCYKNTILVENLKPKYRKSKLYIDIFPIDGYPRKNEKGFFRYYARLNYKRGKVVCNSKEKEVGLFSFAKYSLRKVEEKWYCLWGAQYYIGRIISYVKKNSYTSSEYILCQGGGWNEKGKLKKEVYLNRKLYDFDGIKVFGIVDYHEHLTMMYGDYMQLPPSEKRISNHDYQLYVKNDLINNVLGETEK